MRNGLHVHHIIYRSEQGVDESWNLVAVCHECHDLIHAYKLYIGVTWPNFVGPNGGADKELRFTIERN
jgi:5-methylcytosine-specific restriction endonuclease McrA